MELKSFVQLYLFLIAEHIVLVINVYLLIMRTPERIGLRRGPTRALRQRVAGVDRAYATTKYAGFKPLLWLFPQAIARYQLQLLSMLRSAFPSWCGGSLRSASPHPTCHPLLALNLEGLNAVKDGAPFLVHTPQTSASDGTVPPYRARISQKSLEELDRATQVYRHIDARDYKLRTDKLNDCRTGAFFSRHTETGEVRVASNHCNLRWCPMCANTKRWVITRGVRDWLRHSNYPKLLTLTLKHSELPLAEQIIDLYAYFRKFRNNKFMKSRIKGGVWFFQVKISKRSGQWHPHIHALVEGQWLDHKKMMGLWKSITVDSNIVHIKMIQDLDKGAEHVARYATKPAMLSELSIDEAIEVFDAMHNRRVCGTWGSARKIKLRPIPLGDSSSWENIGSWFGVHHLKNSDENAKAILNAWHNGQPLAAGIICKIGELIPDDIVDRLRTVPANELYLDFY